MQRKPSTPTHGTGPTLARPAASLRLDLPIAAILAAVVLAVFWQVLGNGFVQWDDDITVYQNPHIQGLDLARLRWMLTDVGYSMRYKPIPWLSYAVIYELRGLDPFAFHLVGVLFHCANAVLLFLVLKQLVQAGGFADETRMPAWRLALAAGFAALVWAVHPLRVEPVARVTDLTYCQSLFFLLVSLLCHLQQAGRPGRAWGIAAVASYGLAMLSYPFAVGYVVVLLVLDVWPLRRLRLGQDGLWSQAARRVWREKIPFLLLSGLALMTFVGRMHPTGMWTLQEHRHLGPLAMAMQVSYVWVYYLWRPWWPLDLSPVYTALVWFSPTAWPFLVSAAMVVGLTVLLVLYRRRWPLLLALWVCHLVLLLAGLGLTESPHYTCDRYDYIPAVLWSVLLLAGLCRLRGKVYGLAIAALVAATMLQSSMTIPQTRVWHDSESLFRHTLATLGDDPYRAIIHRRLGMVHAEQGNLDRAIEEYRRSLAISPGAIANRLLAEALEQHGQLEPALFHYGEALKQQPDDARLQGRIGFVLARLGRSRDAVAHLREALRLEPDSASDLNLLAWILATAADATLRDVPTAVRLAERACALTGHRQAELLITLVAAYFQAGRYAEAEHEAERALVAARTSGDPALIARCQALRDHLPQAKAATIPP